MSKHPQKTHETNSKIESGNAVEGPVAETLTQLVSTSQEKPVVETTEEKLPVYDEEKIKTMNVSQSIRYLHALGYTRGQIVKQFPKIKGRTILYQHVRNVLITPVKAT